MLVSRNPQRLQNLEQNLTAMGIKSLSLPIDFLDKGTSLNTYQKLEQDLIDKGLSNVALVVNNAGVNTRGFFRDISAEEVREMVLVNTYPYALMTRQTLTSKVCSESTIYLSICSVIAFLPSAFDAVYAATKAFEVFQLEALRVEQQSTKRRFLIMNP